MEPAAERTPSANEQKMPRQMEAMLARVPFSAREQAIADAQLRNVLQRYPREELRTIYFAYANDLYQQHRVFRPVYRHGVRRQFYTPRTLRRTPSPGLSDSRASTRSLVDQAGTINDKDATGSLDHDLTGLAPDPRQAIYDAGRELREANNEFRSKSALRHGSIERTEAKLRLKAAEKEFARLKGLDVAVERQMAQDCAAWLKRDWHDRSVHWMKTGSARLPEEESYTYDKYDYYWDWSHHPAPCGIQQASNHRDHSVDQARFPDHAQHPVAEPRLGANRSHPSEPSNALRISGSRAHVDSHPGNCQCSDCAYYTKLYTLMGSQFAINTFKKAAHSKKRAKTDTMAQFLGHEKLMIDRVFGCDCPQVCHCLMHDCLCTDCLCNGCTGKPLSIGERAAVPVHLVQTGKTVVHCRCHGWHLDERHSGMHDAVLSVLDQHEALHRGAPNTVGDFRFDFTCEVPGCRPAKEGYIGMLIFNFVRRGELHRYYPQYRVSKQGQLRVKRGHEFLGRDKHRRHFDNGRRPQTPTTSATTTPANRAVSAKAIVSLEDGITGQVAGTLHTSNDLDVNSPRPTADPGRIAPSALRHEIVESRQDVSQARPNTLSASSRRGRSAGVLSVNDKAKIQTTGSEAKAANESKPNESKSNEGKPNESVVVTTQVVDGGSSSRP